MDILYATLGLIITMVISYNILRHWFDQYRLPDIKGKYVLVTGCDYGFGRKLAERLAKKGVKIVAACLMEESAAELQATHPDNILAVQMDVSKPDSIKKAFATVIETDPAIKQGLWGIVNNAGVLGPLVPSDWLEHEDYLKVFNINIFGMINVTNTFLSLVKKAKGRVVNTASYLARFSTPNCAPYCASKYAVRAYADSLRRDMLPFDVSVHVLEPGAFKTNLTSSQKMREAANKIYDKLPAEKQKEYGRHFLDKMCSLQTMSLDKLSSPNVEAVVDAYEHALFATYPRIRYRIGLDTRLIALMALLPDWLLDFPFKMTAIKPGE